MKNSIRTILEISSAIISIRDKGQLFQFIFDTLKPQFGFDDAVINLWEDNGAQLRVWTSDQSASSPSDPNYEQLTRPFPTKGTPYDALYGLESSLLIDLQEQSKNYPDFPGLKLVQNQGYVEDLVFPLLLNGEKLGVFELLSIQQGLLETLDHDLLQAIAHQIAIALSNILANEDILERQKEKEILLGISEAMTTIRDRGDFRRVVMEKIHPLVKFADAVTTVLHTDGEHYKAFLTFTSRMDKEGTPLNDLHLDWTPVPHTEIAYFIEQAPLFDFDTGALLKKFPDSRDLQLAYDARLTHTQGLHLHYGGKLIGFLLFHFFEKPNQQIKEELYKNISEQLAVAMTNIQANEEILRQQREKELLLQISEYLAKVRDWTHLFDTVFEALQPAFQFIDVVLTVGVDGGKKIKVLATNSNSRYQGKKSYETVVRQVLPKPPHLHTIYDLKSPRLFTFEEFEALSPGFPGIQLMKEVGLKATWAGALRTAGRTIGSLEFHFGSQKAAEQLPSGTFASIVDQLSVAVSNILANEDILERQKEKEILLGISEAMTTIRDRSDFRRVVMEKIHPLVKFADAVTTVLNTDADHFKAFLTITEKSGTRTFNDTMDWVPVHESEISYYLDQEALFQFEIKALLEQFPQSRDLELALRAGLRHTQGLQLFYNGKLIGFLLFHFRKRPDKNVKRELYKNISEQMAVAVTNIQANEEILQRQQEKEILLSVSAYLAKVRDWKHLFHTIFDSLQPAFNFVDAVITIPAGQDQMKVLASNADERYGGNQNYEEAVRQTYPKPPHFHAIYGLKKPQIFTIEDYESLSPGFSGVELMKEMGLKASWAGVLRSAGTSIGSLEFHFNSRKEAEELPYHTFVNVLDQLSITVSNILANEEILERQKEKEILLGISESLSKTRNKEEFWEVVTAQIQPVMDFSDAVVVISKGADHHDHFLVEAPEEGKFSTYFRPAVGSHPNAGSPYPFNLGFDEPAIVPLQEWAEIAPEYPGALLMKEQGLTESFRAPLIYSGKKFGLLWFHYKSGKLPRNKLGLFAQIADQIAATVSNILANTDILERQRDKDILLEISEVISTVRDWKQLLQFSFDILKPRFGFDDAVINIWINGGRQLRMLTSDQKSGAPEDANYADLQDHLITTEGTPYEEQYTIDKPTLISLKRNQKRYPHFPGLKLIKNQGYVENLKFPLFFRGGKLGLFELLSKEKGFLSSLDWELLQAIANQIAITVSNILANEDILERQHEKEVLLGISEAMTTIRDREDFKNVVMGKIHPLVVFADAVTTILNTDGDEFKAFIALNHDKKVQGSKLDLPSDWTAVDQTEVAHYKSQGSIFNFEIGKMLQRFPQSLDLQQAQKAGLQHSQGLKLFYGGKLIGFLLFHFRKLPKQKVKDELYKNISEQLAVAVTNILANEEILDQQKEKETLLSISEAMTQVRNREELFQLIMDKLHPLMGFRDAVATQINQDGTAFKTFLTVSPGERKAHPQYREAVDQWIPVAHSEVEWSLAQNELFFLETSDMAQRYPDSPGIKLMAATQLTHSIGLHLHYGGERIGLAYFHFDHHPEVYEKKALLKSIADLLAITVSNILANEEILNRQREKEVLLGISESLSSTRNQKELVNIIFNGLKPIFRYDYFVIVLRKNGGRQHLHWTINTDHALSESDNYAQVHGLMDTEGTPFETYFKKKNIFSSSRAELEQQYPDFPGTRLYAEMGISSSLCAPLIYGGKTLGLLVFNSKDPNYPETVNQALFRNASQQIATAVSNILANEEILKEKAQKEALLAISQDITTVRTKQELLQMVFRRMQPLFQFDDAVISIWTQKKKRVLMLMSDPSTKANELKEYGKFSEGSFAIEGTGYSEAVRLKQPKFYSNTYWEKKYPDFEGVKIMKQMGYVEHLILPLYDKSERIGLLELHSKQPGKLAVQNMEIFKGAADQVAVAVSNILANAEILERQKEKEILLGISEAMTTIRDREDFKNVVMGKIHPLVAFADAVTTILNTDGDRFKAFMTLNQKNKKSVPEAPSDWTEVGQTEVQYYQEQNAIFTFEIDQLLQQFPNSEDLKAAQKSKLRHTQGLQLFYGGRLIGFLLFHFKKKPEKKVKEDLYKNISEQLAVAVTNILANEEILDREKEKETLLSISEELSKIRDKDELFRTVAQKIQPVLEFDYFVIVIGKENEARHQQWTVNEDPVLKEKANYQAIHRQWIPTAGTPFDWFLKARELFFFSDGDLVAKWPNFKGTLLYREMGMRSSACLPLFYGGRQLGVLLLHSQRTNYDQRIKHALLINLSHQVATAVSNILANEDILERQIEKETLLGISESLSKTRNQKALLHIIFEGLQPIFNYDYFVIVLRKADGEYHEHWTINRDEALDESAHYAGTHHVIPTKGTPYEQDFLKTDLYEFTVEDIQRDFPDYPGTRLYVEMGMQSSLCAPLIYAGETLGILLFHSKDPRYPEKVNRPLFKNASQQIATAVSNILANEDILERQREKEILLSISEAMTTIRNRQDLYHVVVDKIQPLVQFAHSVTSVLQRQGEYFKQFLQIGPQWEAQAAGVKWMPVTDSEMNWYLQQEDFFELQIDQLSQHLPENGAMLKEMGIAHSKGLKLFYGGNLIGILLFHFNDLQRGEIKKELYKNISEQIATAVSNILANEDILERREEKETLLSITNDITNIRDRNDLFKVMMSKVKDYIQFDDAVVVTWNTQKDSHRIFLNLASEETKAHPLFKDVVDVKQPMENSPISLFLHTQNLYAWEAQSLLEQFPEYPGLILQKEMGLHHSFNLFLKSGEVPFGLLVFHFKKQPELVEQKEDLLLGIADQVSVAVLNILANEDILQRQQEKETLLSISEDIAKVRSKKELWNVISQKLEPIFDFHSSVTIVSVEETHHKHFMIYTRNDTREHPQYEEVVETLHPNQGSTWDWQLALEGPQILYLEDLMKMDQNHPGFQMMRDLGLTESLGCPLGFGGKKFGFLWFHYESGTLPQEKLQLFGQVADQIAAAVANILANEDILQRQREKESLLRISEYVSQVRNWDDLFHNVFAKLQPIFHFSDAVITVPVEDQLLKSRVFAEKVDHSKYPDFKRLAGEFNRTFPVQPHFEEIYALKRPKYYTIQDYERLSGGFPGVDLMKAQGFVATWANALLFGGQAIGSLEFHFSSKEVAQKVNLSFFANVGNQLSVAVSNILANEDILAREKEKEILLSISEDISAIRNREDLYDVVMHKIKQFIPFDDAVVVSIDKKADRYAHILNLASAERASNPNFEAIVNKSRTISGDALQPIFERPDFKIIDVAEENRKNPEFPGWILMKETGLNYSYKFDLKSGGEQIGVLFFHFTQKYAIPDDQRTFIQNAVNQISTAVSNILANEEVLEREMTRTLQAKIGEIITSENNWQKRFQRISEELREVAPYDYASFVLENEERLLQGCGFQRIGANEYRLIDAQYFFENAQLSKEEYLRERNKITYTRPEIYNGKAFADLCKKDKIKAVVQEMFGLASSLNVPLALSNSWKFQLSLYSKSSDAYSLEHKEMMTRIIASIVHPLERVLAYDLIQTLNTDLTQEKAYLQEEIKGAANFEEIVGSSPQLQKVFEKINQVAYTDSTVLITGETGTGKELIARAVHNRSPRNKKLLIKINCATLPAELLESELFGHEKGAFTGSVGRRIGKFEMAHKGTIFLDEIGELPLDLQSKLLRVLQEKEFERLGSNQVIKTDARIIAATNRNLEKSVAQGDFRADLFYRLNVFPIEVPPLRERKEDIPALAIHFLQRFAKKVGKPMAGISSSSLKELMGYTWPGNVRELEHVIERSVLIGKGGTLKVELDKKSTPPTEDDRKGLFQVKTLQDAERELIINTLQFCGGRVRGKGGAAELLDINPATLDSRMKKLGIQKGHV